jgi:hypothetical protein
MQTRIIDMTKRDSSSFNFIKDSLPTELQSEYEMLVEDYMFAAEIHYGKRFVSYVVLADLIRAGWRRSAEEIN